MPGASAAADSGPSQGDNSCVQCLCVLRPHVTAPHGDVCCDAKLYLAGATAVYRPALSTGASAYLRFSYVPKFRCVSMIYVWLKALLCKRRLCKSRFVLTTPVCLRIFAQQNLCVKALYAEKHLCAQALECKGACVCTIWMDVKLLIIAGACGTHVLPHAMKLWAWVGRETWPVSCTCRYIHIYRCIVPPWAHLSHSWGGRIVYHWLFYTVNVYCDYIFASLYI